MKILVLNCGSSSLKYQLINMENNKVIAKGNCERIGKNQGGSLLTHKIKDQKYTIKEQVDSHEQAINLIIEQLLDQKYGVIESLKEIDAIGHRIVHGGEKFKSSTIINDEVIKAIKECVPLAPIHNPAGLIGIEACRKIMPEKPMVAVFDTAFHQTMPEQSYIYSIPYEYYEKYKIRKYGFHGTSHSYVSKRVAKILNEPLEHLRTVVCHLGQGASICAVNGGKSVDTSMGLTPLSGIPMCTRSGDIDPSIVTFLIKKENLSIEQIESILNKDSGVWGISNISADFRDIETEANNGNKKALLALKIYEYSVAQFIAKYAVSMQGIDAIAFTAGIGENQINVRKAICDNLKFLGVELDEEKNKIKGEESIISTINSKIKILVVPTNEELMIAQDTMQLINNSNK